MREDGGINFFGDSVGSLPSICDWSSEDHVCV